MLGCNPTWGACIASSIAHALTLFGQAIELAMRVNRSSHAQREIYRFLFAGATAPLFINSVLTRSCSAGKINLQIDFPRNQIISSYSIQDLVIKEDMIWFQQQSSRYKNKFNVT